MKKAFVRGLGIILSGLTLLAVAAPGATIARAQPSATSTGALYASVPRVSGLVSSQVGTVEDVLRVALAHVQKRYPVNRPPAATAPRKAAGQVQTEQESWTAYAFDKDWNVKISYPSLPASTYGVTVTNDPLGFSWIGEVTRAGRVTTLQAQDPVGAWNAVYNHLRRQHRGTLPSATTPWQVHMIDPRLPDGPPAPAPGPVGTDVRQLTANRYAWIAEVRYAVGLPPGYSTSYTVYLYNETIGFYWTGEVDTNGRVFARNAASPGPSQGSPRGMPNTSHASARTSPQTP
ncbi:MAG: hypothetical protein M3441_04705 [Chloroflexota bacterium]|nr:hypothetical protein [Chloroflexota bacterium]